MELTTILITLLSAIHGEYQETQLIGKLTNHFQFDHHFFLLDSAIDASQFIDTGGITPRTVYVWKEAADIVEVEVRSKNCLLIVVSETTEFERTVNLLKIIKVMQTSQKQIKVGLFFPLKSSIKELLKLFDWCKDNQITDTFAVTYSSNHSRQCTAHECVQNIYTFRPFDSVTELVNVTNSDKFDVYFQSTNANFLKNELRFGGRIKNNVDGNVWLTVFDRMNASLAEVGDNQKTPMELLKSGADVVKNVYVPRNEKDLDVYPVTFKDYVILVPESLPYSEFLTYLRNGMSAKIFIFSIISTIGSIVVLSILRYTKQKRNWIPQSAADVFNLLLNDNGHIKYQQLFRAEIFVVVPLTFVGFIIVNGILSNFKSHLTRPVLQPQIDTAEDIYISKLPVLTHSLPWKREIVQLLSGRTNYSDWDERIVVDEDEVQKCIEIFDSTKAIFVRSDLADYLLRTQRSLNIRGYHQIPIEFPKFLFTYMVHRRFLFFERLNDMIQRLKNSGLYDLWLRRDFAIREGVILKYNLLRLQHQGTASVERFEFPMLIVYGWLAGLVVFITEIIWKKVKGNSIALL